MIQVHITALAGASAGITALGLRRYIVVEDDFLLDFRSRLVYVRLLLPVLMRSCVRAYRACLKMLGKRH